MGGQLVQLFIGQYGVQVGNACWELFCAENDINAAGESHASSTDEARRFGTDVFFMETNSGKYIPRCLLIDTEPSVIDEIRVGAYRTLFNPRQLINGWEDSAANFARGYYRNAGRLLGPTVEQLRRIAENCDQLQAMVLQHSSGGGTGSGFTCALMHEIQDQFTKCCRLELSLAPSNALSSSTVEPYNALLGMHTPMEFVDCSILLDNQALISLCNDQLWVSKTSLTHLNRLIAQVTSGLYSSVAFETQLSANVNAMLTNLVPFPDAHFVTGALTPLRGTAIGAYTTSSCFELTQSAFDPSQQLLSCLPDHRSVYLSCCLLYRGVVSSRQVNDAVYKLKAIGQLPWVDWCPTGFKVAITHRPMTTIPDSCISPVPCSLLTLHNSTVLLPSLGRLIDDFQMLYTRRAFLHWFLSEGMEEDEFGEALQMLSDLRNQYAEFQNSCSWGDVASSEKPVERHTIKSAAEPMRNYSAKPSARSTTLAWTNDNSYNADGEQTDTLHEFNTAGLFGQTEEGSYDATLLTCYPSLSTSGPTERIHHDSLDPASSEMRRVGQFQINRKHKSVKKKNLPFSTMHDPISVPKRRSCIRQELMKELSNINFESKASTDPAAHSQLHSPSFWIDSTSVIISDEPPNSGTKSMGATNSYFANLSTSESPLPMSIRSHVPPTTPAVYQCTVDL